MSQDLAKKCTVYLADLGYVRLGQEWTIVPLPLNVAYIASFLQSMRPGAFEISIFKNPVALLEAISRKAPDIAAFSNYIWNKNLALAFAQHVKNVHPGCITVMGGPNYNFKELPWVSRFAKKHRQIDFHIDGEGEVKFYNLVACALEHGLNLDALKRANPAGVAYLDPTTDELVSNDLKASSGWTSLDGVGLDLKAGRLLDLNDIPSPYLSGLLDEFLLDPNYCPILETNRGCPYACTFCNWGDLGKAKSSLFGHDRVHEELRYIATKNVSKTPYLYLGDANFGLFEHDVETAKLLRDLKASHGFPQNVYLYFAKNSSDKVIRIAEILKDMTRINLSRQTQNPEVLKNIKRGNISMDTFSRLADLARSLGTESFVELIYALPGESKASFFAGVRDLMHQRVDGLHLFPAMLLDGAEMGTQASRDRYGIQGEFRQIDGCAGHYGPITTMEFEEIITTTHAMSRDDYFEIRIFHLFQAIFLDTKLYRDTETLMGDADLFDLIEDIIRHRASAPAPVRKLIDEFIAGAEAELLKTPPTEFTVAQVEAALAGSVKLNPMFTCKLLYDPGVRQAFQAFVKERILEVGQASEEDIDNVLRHIDQSIYPFDGSVEKEVSMAFDAPAFARRLSGKVRASDYALPAPVTFRYTKALKVQPFLEAMPAHLPLSTKIYEILLHHTHEILRKTVSWSIQAEAVDRDAANSRVGAGQLETADRRQIETEGGWTY